MSLLPPPWTGGSPLLVARGFERRFGGQIALNRVDLDLWPGEVHAILGGNRAGKTTLVLALAGVDPPDRGSLWVRGTPVLVDKPGAAARAGVALIGSPVPPAAGLTVAECVVLGREPRRFPGRLDRRRASQAVRELAEPYGLEVDPEARVEGLPFEAWSRIELLRALYRGAPVLLFDEPDALLGPEPEGGIPVLLRRLAKEGRAVLFTTRDAALAATADRVSVLRRGAVALRWARGPAACEADAAALLEATADPKGPPPTPVRRDPGVPGPVILFAEGLEVRGDQGRPAVREASFELHAGEILGIAARPGNGASELVEALTGLRPASAGVLKLRGREIGRYSPRQAVASGIGHIPEDRRGRGLILPFTVAENLALHRFDRPPFARPFRMNWGALREHARATMAEYGIAAADEQVPVETLSEGDRQRVVVARELSLDPDVLVAAFPSQGLDPAARRFVHQRLLQVRRQGKAVLLVSRDPQELLALADRVAVLRQGRLSPAADTQRLSAEELWRWIGGKAPVAPAPAAPARTGGEHGASGSLRPPGPAGASEAPAAAGGAAATAAGAPVEGAAEAAPLQSGPRRRQRRVQTERLRTSIWAAILGFAIGALFIAWAGKKPLATYRALWGASFGSLAGFGELLVEATPLVLSGLAFAVPYRTGLFNLGGEGQLLAGQLAAAWAGYALSGLPAGLHALVALGLAAAAGALWAGLPGYLRARLGAHEVISTLMMNYIAFYGAHWLVTGPLLDPAGAEAATPAIAEGARLARLLGGSAGRLHSGLLVALAAALAVWWLLWRSPTGYGMRAVGLNPRAAHYGGVRVGRVLLLAMLWSGLLAGLAGAVQVLGLQYRYYDQPLFTGSIGYGFSGVAVALLGNSHPGGVLASSLLLGFLSRGTAIMQSAGGLSRELVGLVQAAIIFSVAANEVILRVRARQRRVLEELAGGTQAAGEQPEPLEGAGQRAGQPVQPRNAGQVGEPGQPRDPGRAEAQERHGELA